MASGPLPIDLLMKQAHEYISLGTGAGWEYLRDHCSESDLLAVLDGCEDVPEMTDRLNELASAHIKSMTGYAKEHHQITLDSLSMVTPPDTKGPTLSELFKSSAFSKFKPHGVFNIKNIPKSDGKGDFIVSALMKELALTQSIPLEVVLSSMKPNASTTGKTYTNHDELVPHTSKFGPKKYYSVTLTEEVYTGQDHKLVIADHLKHGENPDDYCLVTDHTKVKPGTAILYYKPTDSPALPIPSSLKNWKIHGSISLHMLKALGVQQAMQQTCPDINPSAVDLRWDENCNTFRIVSALKSHTHTKWSDPAMGWPLKLVIDADYVKEKYKGVPKVQALELALDECLYKNLMGYPPKPGEYCLNFEPHTNKYVVVSGITGSEMTYCKAFTQIT